MIAQLDLFATAAAPECTPPPRRFNPADPFLAALMGTTSPAPADPPPPAADPAPKTPPSFYRCTVCLNIFTTREELPRDGATYGAQCPCGNRRLEYMGAARRPGGLFITRTLCPCDARCTSATGPQCDCQCGGANHGTGRLIRVETRTGDVPLICPKDPAQCMADRAEMEEAEQAARQRMRDRYDTQLDDFRARRWIPRGAWDGIRQALDQLRHARTLLSKRGRLAALAKVCK